MLGVIWTPDSIQGGLELGRVRVMVQVTVRATFAPAMAFLPPGAITPCSTEFFPSAIDMSSELWMIKGVVSDAV